jgi:hypothetical protein
MAEDRKIEDRKMKPAVQPCWHVIFLSFLFAASSLNLTLPVLIGQSVGYG